MRHGRCSSSGARVRRVRRERASKGSEGVLEFPHTEIASELYGVSVGSSALGSALYGRRRARRSAVRRRYDAMKGGTTRRGVSDGGGELDLLSLNLCTKRCDQLTRLLEFLLGGRGLHRRC